MSTTILAPTDVFGIVHDFTRTNPVPPMTSIDVSFQHFVWNGSPMLNARIGVHGRAPEFLAALLTRLGADIDRPDDDHIQGKGSDRPVNVQKWNALVEVVSFVDAFCGGMNTGCEQDAEEEPAFGGVRAVNPTIDHGPTCPFSKAVQS